MDPTTQLDTTRAPDDTNLERAALRPRSVVEPYGASPMSPEQVQAVAWLLGQLSWEAWLDDLRAATAALVDEVATTARDRE